LDAAEARSGLRRPSLLVELVDGREHGGALVVEEAAQRAGLLLEGAFCRRGHIDTEM
jgi:hypothetical protein